MNILKNLLLSFLAVLLLVGLSADNVRAAEAASTGYTYTVTFYAGNQGIFGEEVNVSVDSSDAVVLRTEDKVVVSGLHAGEEVGLTAQEAVVLEATGKYYVKGIRLSGRDNGTVAASAFIVDGDADYVVAYGIKGNQVSYTVNYQDKDGNALADSQTFYGNIGDKPVIAYKYIAGYVPTASGLTKTLSENAMENVFTFEYTKAPVQTTNTVVTDVVTEVIKEEVKDVVVAVPGNAEGNGEPDIEEGVEAGDEDRIGETDVENGETDGEGDGVNNGEEDDEKDNSIIVDLDDEEVPLADTEPDIDASGSDDILVKYIGLIVAAIAALVALTAVVFFLRKRSKEESEES